MSSYRRLNWRPEIGPEVGLEVEEIKRRFAGKQFVVFKNGTCVIWHDDSLILEDVCRERILLAVEDRPDFKVRAGSDGVFLVTFRGGIGALVFGNFLRDHLHQIRDVAFSQGVFLDEDFSVEDFGSGDEVLLVAGLYARARLYLDAEDRMIVYNSSKL